MQKDWKFETLQLHAGHLVDETGSRAVPIYQTTSYVFDDCQHAKDVFDLKVEGNIYTRLTNPTNEVLEKRMAALEGGIGALAFASGAAAVTAAIMNIAFAGDNIVSANTLYGGTFNLFAHTLPLYGITTKFVHPDNVEGFEEAIDKRTKAVYIEALGNPNANIIDIAAIAAIAHRHQIPLLIDSTFATPYLLKPIDWGADIIVHSATKFIGGHGTSLGGIIVDSGKFNWAATGKFPCLTEPDPSYHGISYTETFGEAAYIMRARTQYLRDTGACISPFNSFLLLQGLETLSLRVERHVENGYKAARFLEASPHVEKVNHPMLEENRYYALGKKYFPKGSGSIFTFEIKGGYEAAKTFTNHLEIFSLLANVADAKSLVIHPASTTHGQLSQEDLLAAGIKENSIRLSIGLENIEDILEDLNQALEKAAQR